MRDTAKHEQHRRGLSQQHALREYVGPMKEELLYGRFDTEKMTIEELKDLIWRYCMSYWNNRKICSASGGLPPLKKRVAYYAAMKQAA